ncbi:hypothetical protein BCF58_0345 [Chryseobacterium defluvii]|uniref:Uncharacterized protein n=1 Tax=Chryseobacterium defluvii TaxID=160396 RepID=A0A495SNX8_9FLAO|nr:hypothetical protein BCF58_0345 [Chryseobacterium defluvii]
MMQKGLDIAIEKKGEIKSLTEQYEEAFVEILDGNGISYQ